MLQYPVIICSSFDKLYRIDMGSLDQQPVLIDSKFVMEVNYAGLDDQRTQQRNYFPIDIVSFEKIYEFLNAIDVEAEGNEA